MNDKIIRQHLLHKLNFEFPNSTKERNLIVNEMAICRGISVADVAVVNGSLHCYEIKSSEDNLNRLNFQLKTYSNCFDYISVVTTKKHLDKVRILCPRSVGIYEAKEVSSTVEFIQRRKAKKNNKVDSVSLLQLLWKEELIELVRTVNLKIAVKSKSKSYLWDVLATKINKPLLQEYVRSTLKARVGWKADLQLE